MTTRVLDTNTLVYALNDTGGVRQRLNLAALEGKLVTSTAVVAELLYGAEKSANPEKNRQNVYRGIANLKVVPFTLKTAEHYGRIKAEVMRKGKPRTRIDLMVAATAMELGATAVTHDGDLKDTDLMTGLKVEDWHE